MLLDRLRNRLQGGVRLRMESAFPERILNLMSARALRFWDLHYESETEFSCTLSETDAAQLRALVVRWGGSCETVAVQGTPFFLRRFRRRHALLISLCLAAVLLLWGSFFIWEFEVEGDSPYSREQILRVLAEEGVRLGTYGRSIDSELLRNRVLLRLTELSWISVRVSGCKAHVQVRSRVHAPELIEDLPPQNLVARREGLITQVAAQGGKAVVQRGSTVEKGDLLISGFVDYEGSAAASLPAAGRVEARTWYTLTCSLPRTSAEKKATGKHSYALSLVFGTHRIKIFGGTGIHGGECDTIINRKHWYLFSLPLPIVSVWEKHSAYEPEEHTLSADTARREGEALLLAYLRSVLSDGEVLADTVLVGERGDRFQVTLRAECLEDIAEVQRIP